MKLSSANAFNIDKAEILTSVNGKAVNASITKNPLENIVGKGENAGNQHFLLFPQCFLSFPEQFSIIQSRLLCRLQML